MLVLPLLLALIAALGWATTRPDPFGLVLVLGHTALALYMRRNVPFLAIVAAPVLARAATQALGARDTGASGRLRRIQIVFVLALAVLALSTIPRRAELEPNIRAASP